jgi:putative ABC transport system permease protein
MELQPILSSMRRNKVGAILIGVQIAITLAILCNGIFIIEQRLALSQRPSGVDEAALFAIDNEWVGAPGDIAARQRADIAALRALPGVVDAYNTNEYPLTNSGWSEAVQLKPDALAQSSTSFAALYMGDEHALNTLGLKLVAGRNFEASEIGERRSTDRVHTAVIIITRALAQALFPDGKALGQSIYVEGNKQPTLIIGIVERLQMPWTSAGGWAEKYFENSMIEPYRFVEPDSWYMVRAQPGQLATVMKAARAKLLEIDRERLLDKIEAVSDTRTAAYQDDRGLAVILAVVCACLLGVTACGIVGLTSYWVAQRRRQIGIRRALGATRGAILRYFQTENLLIAGAGALVGIGLAVGVNLWMVTSFAMPRLAPGWTAVGALGVLLLGQLAVLWPALRAASVPPALATRSP